MDELFEPLLIIGLLMWGLLSAKSWTSFALATAPSFALLTFVVLSLIYFLVLLFVRRLTREPKIDLALSKSPHSPSVLQLWLSRDHQYVRREFELLPFRSLSTLLSVSVFYATLAGIAVGVGVALLGWPAFLALNWMFGLPPGFEVKLTSFLSTYVLVPSLYTTALMVGIAPALSY